MSAQARIKRLASETAVYGVSSIVGRLINFLLFPLYSQVFAPDVYEPIIVLYAAFIFLNILYQHGMESSYLKFATDRDELQGRSKAFSTALISVVILSILLSVVVWFARGSVGSIVGLSPDYQHLFSFAALIMLLDAVAVVPFADLRLRNRPWLFAGIRVANIVVNVTLNIVLIFVFELGIEAILIANVIASATSVVLLVPVSWPRFSSFDPGLWKKMIRFGMPFVPGGLGYAITERVNIFFLERMDPETVQRLYGLDAATHPELHERALSQGMDVYTQHIVGTYGGMIKLAVLMALFVQMFRYAWQPFFLQRQHDTDAPELYSKVFGVLTLVLLSAFLGIAFLADDLVGIPLPGGRTLIASGYWMGLSIIPIALVGYVFQGWYYHFSAGAYLRDRSRYFLHATLVGSAVAILLNAFLVPDYGMWAAALATSAAYTAMALTLLFLIRRHYPIDYRWNRIIPACVTTAVFFFTWYYFGQLQTWWIELLMVSAFALLAAKILKIPILRSIASLLGR
jgi:O-antigen/teichoic acid export membrane protein